MREATDRRAARRGRRASKILARLPLLVICAFLTVPLLVVIVASLNAENSFRFPPAGLSLRWYEAVIDSSAWTEALAFSGQLLLLVVPVTVLLGTLGGYAIGAGRFPGRNFLSLFFLSPVAVPGIMVGLALLYQLQGLGLVGSLRGLWVAHLLATFPFCVRVVAVSAAAIDPMVLRAAQSLGASPIRVFFTVTLPLLRPGILAATFLAAVLSLAEVAISVLVSGAGTSTVPVQIYSAAQVQLEPSVAAVSTLLLLGSVVIIAVLDRSVGLSRLV